MIYGIGTDIIEVFRIKDFFEKGKRDARRYFTEDEIVYCMASKDPYQYYAARFSAKQAFAKALGTVFTNGISYNQIEVYNVTSGQPKIRLTGAVKTVAEKKGIAIIHVSLAHDKNWANAVVILESHLG
jgi:holo-[acyl-carrier protein] synthase